MKVRFPGSHFVVPSQTSDAKIQLLYSSTKLKSRDKVLNEIEKNNCIVSPDRRGHLLPMLLKLCCNLGDVGCELVRSFITKEHGC